MQKLKEFFAKPIHDDMSAKDLFLVTGLILVSIGIWQLVLFNIARWSTRD